MSHREHYRESRVRTTRWPTAPSTSTVEEFRDKARELWRNHGILVVWPDQNIGGWPEQAQRDNIGNRLYGRRKCEGR